MIKTDKDHVPIRTDAEARALKVYKDNMIKLERYFHDAILCTRTLPLLWAEISREYSEEKQRVTIRLDKSVVDFFKATGPGYQTRMNSVLLSFVSGKKAGLMSSVEDLVRVEDSMRASQRNTSIKNQRYQDYAQGRDWKD